MGVQHFYVWKFGKLKRLVTIMFLALFTAIFLWSERDGIYTVFSKVEPVVFSKGDVNEDNISLTFNISWGEDKIYEILEELANHQVKATFFVSGEWAERHPEIIEKISEDKHELGMLGYRYKSYLKQDIEQVRKDLHLAQEVFKKMGYDNVNQLRTPNGHFNTEVIELAKQLGLQVVHWNINPHDWKNPGSQTIVDTIMGQTTNGDVILLHASDAAKQTSKALQTILPGLKNKGFEFVPISKLISQADSKEELVE